MSPQHLFFLRYTYPALSGAGIFPSIPDLNFMKASREAAALINLATLQTELNKQLARIALPNDDPIEKARRASKPSLPKRELISIRLHKVVISITF